MALQRLVRLTSSGQKILASEISTVVSCSGSLDPTFSYHDSLSGSIPQPSAGWKIRGKHAEWVLSTRPYRSLLAPISCAIFDGRANHVTAAYPAIVGAKLEPWTASLGNPRDPIGLFPDVSDGLPLNSPGVVASVFGSRVTSRLGCLLRFRTCGVSY